LSFVWELSLPDGKRRRGRKRGGVRFFLFERFSERYATPADAIQVEREIAD
jgi:hypothetical protein